MVPTSDALPRDQRGRRGANTGNVLGLDVPNTETPGLAATVGAEGDGVVVLIPSQSSEGPSVFGASALLRDSSCQAGGDQQLGEPHLITDAAGQLPHLQTAFQGPFSQTPEGS